MDIRISFDLVDEEEDGFDEDLEDLKNTLSDMGYEFENFKVEVI